jgi:hypothetical protein
MRRYMRLALPLLGAGVLSAAILTGLPLGHNGTGRAYVAAGPVATSSPSATTERDLSVPVATEVTMPLVTVSADFTVMFSTVGELKQAADLVVDGEVVDVSYLDFNTCAYTKVTLKVAKCLKGAAAAGDKIVIAEVGGITTLKTIVGDKFGPMSEADAATKVKVQLDGAPLARVGDTCTYFLGKGSIGVLSGAYYVPVGAFQGRFVVEDGVSKRFVPADWETPKYTDLATTPSDLDKAIMSSPATAAE